VGWATQSKFTAATAATNTIEIVFFISFPFQRLSLPRILVRDKLQQGTVNTFALHILRSFNRLLIF
jgi:hypothetical protein